MSGLYQSILGVSSKVLIETRGLINPPRLAALALSSPNSSGIAGFLAAQGAGLLGGSAMRPGDMAFPGRGGKPMSVVSQNQVQKTVKYYIRETPYPPSIVGKLLSGQQSLKGAAITAARAGAAAVASSILPGGGGLKNLVKNVKDSLKKKSPSTLGDGYGDTYNKKEGGGYFAAPIKTTTHTNKGKVARNISKLKADGDLVESLEATWTPQWEILNEGIITGRAEVDTGTTIIKPYGIADNKNINFPYILLQQYGKPEEYMLLPGTISGFSETVTPEWQSFRYVGSPFQTHRYNGVERTIKFNVRLYSEGFKSKNHMMKMLDKLRRTAFPDEDIAEIKYGNTVLFGFNPNLYHLTIHGYYKKLLGLVTDVSINIDDGMPWPTVSDDNNDKVITEPFPMAVDVSIGMKVIEDIPIEGTKIKYKDGVESKLTNKNYPD